MIHVQGRGVWIGKIGTAAAHFSLPKQDIFIIKIQKNKTNPFISQKQKPHSEVSSVLTLPRQLPYEQAMYCFYIRRQKGNRAVGWDTDCSGIRLGRFSGQLYVFPLLCVILLCAAWKRAIKQCGRDSKRRVSESFYSPLSDTYISAKA